VLGDDEMTDIDGTDREEAPCDGNVEVLLLQIWVVRFGALEEVFLSYRPHGAWRTMEVLEELA
jgi:hypothetical protein